MATTETVTATIDRLIALFNAKGMDLPDGFFDRRTQFVLNGAPFGVAEAEVAPADLDRIKAARLPTRD